MTWKKIHEMVWMKIELAAAYQIKPVCFTGESFGLGKNQINLCQSFSLSYETPKTTKGNFFERELRKCKSKHSGPCIYI